MQHFTCLLEASEGKHWFGWLWNRSLDRPSQVVVRLSPEDRPQTPHREPGIVGGALRELCSINQIATRNRSLSKTDVAATKGQFVYTGTKWGHRREQGVSEAFVSEADHIKAVSYYK